MSIEDIIAILKAVFSGKMDIFEAVHKDPRLILLPFITTLLGIAPVFLSIKNKDGEPKAGHAAVCFLGALLLALPFLVDGRKPDGPQTGTSRPPPVPKKDTAPPPVPAPTPTTEARIEKFSGYTLTGRPLGGWHEMPTAECEARCAADPECSGLIYGDKQRSCQLKKDPGERVPATGYTAGIKVRSPAPSR
jgi:hypothetical protein